jgi:hypothetical protein
MGLPARFSSNSQVDPIHQPGDGGYCPFRDWSACHKPRIDLTTSYVLAPEYPSDRAFGELNFFVVDCVRPW